MQGSTYSLIPGDTVLLKQRLISIAAGLLCHDIGMAPGARDRAGLEGTSSDGRMLPCSKRIGFGFDPELLL
jgi:hypothetical protein